MKISILTSLLFLVLTSCGKNKEVKIIAKSAVTGAHYPGLTYYIVEEKTGYDGEEFKTIATGQLNSNGEAMVSIKRKKNRSYVVRIAEPSNTCYNKQISQSFDSPFDVNGTFTFEFAECAYVKLSINNVNCQNASDLIKLYHIGSDVDFNNSISGTPIKTGNGCYTYLGSNFSDVPIGKRYYKWEVTKLGITNTYYDTINLIPGEYKTITIDY